MYMSSLVIYSIIMTYTVFASIYIVVVQLESPTTSFRLGNNIFTNLIVSTGSTIGIYFLMSFLYLDPWHMFTSSGQYFALLPSYICTLQVYAFCNTHDVSWGTKGDNVIHIDLGAAVSGKGNTVELEMPSEQLDIDSGYDEALRNLRDRLEVPKDGVSKRITIAPFAHTWSSCGWSRMLYSAWRSAKLMTARTSLVTSILNLFSGVWLAWRCLEHWAVVRSASSMWCT